MKVILVITANYRHVIRVKNNEPFKSSEHCFFEGNAREVPGGGKCSFLIDHHWSRVFAVPRVIIRCRHVHFKSSRTSFSYITFSSSVK